MRLCERISHDRLWPVLEQAAIQTVIAGGIAAMGFYRDAWRRQSSLDKAQKNPSTMADLEATVSILQTCHALLSPIAGQLRCGLSYLGEEATHDEYLRTRLTDEVLTQKHTPQRFFESPENVLRVIFDGIDGTSNFDRRMPLFCTAAAILIDDQVRLSALYDPIHHQVYSAILPGPYDQAESDATAFAWEVATGNRRDLVDEAEKKGTTTLEQEAVALHLSRSSQQKLDELLGERSEGRGSILKRLAVTCRGVYALNSGLLAMTRVATGDLGAYINNSTCLWDVAAGEVLVRATGGSVSRFDGTPIRYRSAERIAVVAAKRGLHSTILDLLAGTGPG